jgi:hypothetical protein
VYLCLRERILTDGRTDILGCVLPSSSDSIADADLLRWSTPGDTEPMPADTVDDGECGEVCCLLGDRCGEDLSEPVLLVVLPLTVLRAGEPDPAVAWEAYDDWGATLLDEDICWVVELTSSSALVSL